MSDSEDDRSSLSESSSANSTPQSEEKGPLSPRDFWREKTGKSTALKRGMPSKGKHLPCRSFQVRILFLFC